MAIDKIKDAILDRPRLPKERQHFALLTLSNPNYFGNDPNSKFKPGVKSPFINQTTYEDIDCVGLHPQLDFVEAVVAIKQNNGYGGEICDPGSLEYVRFYADYTNSGTWTDLGVTSVRVHDIAGPKPLCYTVRVPVIDPPRKHCTDNNLIKIRAILSWSLEPPPNQPNWPPVWGQAVDATVQLRPTFEKPWWWFVSELSKVDISAALQTTLSAIDPNTILKVKPKKLGLAEKSQLYAKADVPLHRFGFAEVKDVQKNLPASAALTSFSIFDTLKLSTNAIEDLINVFQTPSHDSKQYEELTCAGYRPEEDSVGAVLKIKQTTGYSGELCTIGSTEFVAFWLDTGSWNYLGTAAVQVHDLDTVPVGGVHYAVNLPVETLVWQQLCSSGAKVAKLRAVLSWSEPPSTTDPNYTPHWGNRVDVLIQLRPGDPATVGEPYFINISGKPADPATIDAGTGLVIATRSPFGGALALRGALPGYAGPHRYYKLEVVRIVSGAPSGSPRPLVNPVTLAYTEDNGTGPVDCDTLAFGVQTQCYTTVTPIALPGSSSGSEAVWYQYQKYVSGGVTRYLVDQTLGYWMTEAEDEGTWEIRLTFRNTLTGVETITAVQRVHIDNTQPFINASWDASVDATCRKIGLNVPVTGVYSVTDATTRPFGRPHLSSIRVSVHPALTGAVVAFNPTVPTTSADARPNPPLPDLSESGSFTFKSATACGYSLLFEAYDRTIVGHVSGGAFWTSGRGHSDELGICVD